MEEKVEEESRKRRMRRKVTKKDLTHQHSIKYCTSQESTIQHNTALCSNSTPPTQGRR